MATPLDPTQTLLQTTPEIADLTRQRQMAQMLLAQGLQQPQSQMVGNRYVPVNPMERVGNLASALIGNRANEVLDEKSLNIANALRGKKAQEITAFQQAMANPETRGQAIVNAQNSQFPELAAMANEITKPRTMKKDEEFQMYLPMAGKTETFGQGAISLPSGMESAQVALGLPKNPATWNTEQRQAASMYEMKLKQLGANNTLVNLHAFEPYLNKVQGKMGESLVGEFDTLKSIPAQIAQLDKVASLAPKSFAGNLGQQKLEGAKFLNNTLGLNVATDKIQNTEQLNTVLFTNIMENLKKMDASPSQMQQAEMQKGLGSIATDPQALPKVVNIYKEILLDKAKEHNRRVNESMSGPAKARYAYDITIPIPGGKSGAGADVRSQADEILGK
jgi:hypothetical protein